MKKISQFLKTILRKIYFFYFRFPSVIRSLEQKMENSPSQKAKIGYVSLHILSFSTFYLTVVSIVMGFLLILHSDHTWAGIRSSYGYRSWLLLDIIGISSITGVFYFITGRLRFSAFLMIFLAILMAFGYYFKRVMLNDVLHIEDVSMLSELIPIIKMSINAPLYKVAFFVSLFAYATLLVYSWVKDSRSASRHCWTARTLALIPLLLILLGTKTLHIFPNMLRSEATREMEFSRGIYSPVLISLQSPISPPDNYGEDLMKAISAKYGTFQTDVKIEEKNKINVIFYLVESYQDPHYYGIDFSTEPAPYLNALKKKYSSGTLYPNIFGAPTSTTVMDFMTGIGFFSAYKGIDTLNSLMSDQTPSLPDFLLENGYHTYYFSNMHYHRYPTYLPMMGFEHNTDAADLKDWYGFFDGKFLLDYVKSVYARNKGPKFIGLQMMTTHGPMLPRFKKDEKAIMSNPDFQMIRYPSHISQEEKIYFTEFAYALRKADNEIKDFLAFLEKSDQKTLVIFFGDHQIGMPSSFYEKTQPHLRDKGGLFKTPIVVWANYPRERKELYLSGNKIPLLVLNELKLQRYPYQFEIFRHLLENYEALSFRHYRKKVDTDTHYRPDESDPETESIIKDYLTVEYDITKGRGYLLGRQWKNSFKKLREEHSLTMWKPDNTFFTKDSSVIEFPKKSRN